MRQSTYGMQRWSTATSGVDVLPSVALSSLVHRHTATTVSAPGAGAPCRPWSGSMVHEILALFGNAVPAIPAKGAPRLKEPST